MHEVATFLKVSSPTDSSCSAEDLARSAYSRFYYAAFLEARRLVSEIDIKWRRIGHSALPEVMRGQVRKILNEKIRNAKKRDDDTRVRQIEALKSGLTQVADLLDQARKIREIADYDDVDPISVERGVFVIDNLTLQNASDWKRKCEAALYASRQIEW